MLSGHSPAKTARVGFAATPRVAGFAVRGGSVNAPQMCVTKSCVPQVHVQLIDTAAADQEQTG